MVTLAYKDKTELLSNAIKCNQVTLVPRQKSISKDLVCFSDSQHFQFTAAQTVNWLKCSMF